MAQLVVHVSEADLTEATGMGRVAVHWKRAFLRRGYDFVHIGPYETGRVYHPSLFPAAAYRAYERLKRQPVVLLVHEPASGTFVRAGIPLVAVSHGIERRGWELALKDIGADRQKIRLRSKLLYPLWRLRNCDVGLRKANRLLLINREDAEYAQRRYGRNEDSIFVFKNGVYPIASDNIEDGRVQIQQTLLFVGSWIERKGIGVLTKAAHLLDERGIRLRWILAGTGAADPNDILRGWPEDWRPLIEVIPQFKPSDEGNLYARAQLFVLPSHFEGQPLSLLQAMASGLCCIASNCCGQRDLIQSWQNGVLHEPGRADQLADAIETLVGNPDLRSALGQNGRNSVFDRRWETVSDEVVTNVEANLISPSTKRFDGPLRQDLPDRPRHDGMSGNPTRFGPV